VNSPLRQLAAAAAVALAAMPWSAGAASKLYKCIEGGRTVYQQQACPVQSDPATAASAEHAAPKASAVAVPASAGERKVKGPSPAASSAPATRR
jgi:hypothetical protein